MTFCSQDFVLCVLPFFSRDEEEISTVNTSKRHNTFRYGIVARESTADSIKSLLPALNS